MKKRRYPSREHVFRDEDYARYYVNSHGLLGPERSADSDPTVYRIAVFGDSLVEALKVSQEERFTSRLEGTLSPPSPYRRVEVWSFGFSGDNTGNAYARWLYQAKEVPFNLVIFSFNETDVFENRPEDTTDPIGGFLVRQPDGSFALDLSRSQQTLGWFDFQARRIFGRCIYSVYTLTKHVRRHLTDKSERWRRLINGEWFTEEGHRGGQPMDVKLSQDAVNSTCQQLAYVQSAIASEGVPVLLLGLPSGSAVLQSEIERNPLTNRAYLAVADCLAKTAGPFLDTYPALSAMAMRTDPFTEWERPGAHLNIRGNHLVADSLRDFLTRNVQLGLVNRVEG